MITTITSSATIAVVRTTWRPSYSACRAASRCSRMARRTRCVGRWWTTIGKLLTAFQLPYCVLDLAAVLRHVAVPQLSQRAFMSCAVDYAAANALNDGGELPLLLPGPAAVFVDNAFATHAQVRACCTPPNQTCS